MKFMKLTAILLAVMIQTILASPGLAAEQASEEKTKRPTVLLVTDHAGELPTLTTLLEKNGYEVKFRPQKEIDAPITGYHAVFVYVHKTLLPQAETELVNYAKGNGAKGGGRLIVLHHGLASAKAKNLKWLDLLGVKFYPRDDKKYPWCVTDPTNFRVVNLMPEHYITSHKVEYDKKTEYTSRDRPNLAGSFPAFDLPHTEVYHNMQSTDGNAKVILLGSQFKADADDPDAAKKPTMEETAGWYKRTGRGWTFYFQMGHSEADFRNPSYAQILLNCLAWQPDDPKYAAAPTSKPLFKTVDLNVGESTEVTLVDGQKVSLKLLDLKQQFDSIRHAVRSSTVTVEIDGKPVELGVATYRLPITVAGLQIDCPVAGEYVHSRPNSQFNPWKLNKNVRLRLWPAGSPWVRPETYGYHTKGGWFFSDTQMGSEPCYVNACDKKTEGNIYYHYGLDIGGNEGQQEIVAATDGVVVSAREAVLPGYANNLPVKKRGDVVYMLDQRGWFYRYSHFHTIYDSIQPGRRVKRGEPLGLLGKEGASGGWAHCHFDVNAIQPTGGYGIEEAYPFMWQAYRDASGTKLEAIARPHHFIQRTEEVTLDGTRSWSATETEKNTAENKAGIVSYEWTFCDGTTAKGPQVTRRYDTSGSWCETLKVTDREGRVDYDFCVVLVADLNHKESKYPPVIHATFHPTTGIKVGDPITFKVRSFGIDAKDGHEEWDFGDGMPTVQVQSDGNKISHAKDGYVATMHRYAKPGSYLVSVRRTNCHGQTAIGRLHVVVE